MFKALAVLRTAFLVFIVGYTLLNTPVDVWGTSTLAVSIDALRRVNRAAWIAIAWIALETVLGWIVVRFRRKPTSPPAAAPGVPPPAAS